ncbi:MAG: (Fe-S)-binding protein [Deltaproteobacteria bacterium]|nr:(Fe-S)-binding protein [Deltaproteobacteria bacterium]
MSPIAMTLLLVLTLGAFAWAMARRWRQLMVGTADPDFRFDLADFSRRIQDTVIYAFGQKKMPNYKNAGYAHMVIFASFMILTLNTVQLVIRGYAPRFDFWGVLAEDAPLGMGYMLVKELLVVGCIVGASMFVYFRTAKAGISDEQAGGTNRMTLGNEGLVILGIIITMMFGDLLYYGAWGVLEARTHGGVAHFEVFAFASSALGLALDGMSDGTVTLLAHVGFWGHSALVLIFLNILPFSKHFHIITVMPNVFTHPITPPGRLPPVDDIEGKMEREESIGINKLEDLTWNHILDLYTCTECGRCSDNCPAYTTDKKLSPKHLTLALRNHLYDTEGAMFAAAEGIDRKYPSYGPQGDEGDEAKEPLHANPPAPEGGYFQNTDPAVELVPNIVDPDVIWACTSCRACEEQCPVQISYVDKIVGMRRELVMNKGEMPPELQRPFMGMEMNGNPWNLSSSDRGAWTDKLREDHGVTVPFLADHADAEVIYWAGCAASFDNRAQKTAQALVRLLDHARVDYAILGTEETCTGDPARRAGNEYLFQMLAEQNVETLNGYGAGKKTIVTACPHCFNTLVNEYPDFGGKYDVVHHSEFLNGLIARGKIVPEKRVEATVAFHDSCYLGRYNDVYDEPREVLAAIPGVKLREVPYWNKSKGLCCGAGGAQMFMEEQTENRVNEKRTLQLLDTGCDTIASGCPFCMTMLTDGLKAEEKEDQVDQLDIAEMLVKSVIFRADSAEVDDAAE